MSTFQSNPRLARVGRVFGTAMVAVGVLIALAVTVVMLALTSAYRLSTHLTTPAAAPSAAARGHPAAQPRP